MLKSVLLAWVVWAETDSALNRVVAVCPVRGAACQVSTEKQPRQTFPADQAQPQNTNTQMIIRPSNSCHAHTLSAQSFEELEIEPNKETSILSPEY